MPEKFIYDGSEFTLPSPNGLVFQSKAGAYQLCVRGTVAQYDHGIHIGDIRELIAEFGETNAPVYHDEETGESYVQIRGHYMNTLEQGKQKGWTDDERALVEKKLIVTQKPDDHWLHTKPATPKPWPTYDETLAAKVAPFAEELGLVYEATVYEAENKNRKSVMEALRAATQEPTEEELAAV